MTTEAAAQNPPSNEDIAEHLPLVQRIVAHFMRRLPRSVQREDLVAAGTLGLFHALRSSEHTCPEMFAAYARIRIRGSIVDELRRHDWSPRRRKETGATANGNAPATVSSIVGASIPPVRPRVAVVGFDDLPAGSGMPSKAIAQAMGLSEARISQLHARATSRLKELMQLTEGSDGSATREAMKLAA